MRLICWEINLLSKNRTLILMLSAQNHSNVNATHTVQFANYDCYSTVI